MNTTGGANTATGGSALENSVSASYNTATGVNALLDNGIDAVNPGAAGYNTATGYSALRENTGALNTATGVAALQNNKANNNTATGANALFNNTTGVNNTANGTSALNSNTTGPNNTANGYRALFSSLTGQANTATGVSALQANTTREFNAAGGYQALFSNTTGNHNTATGANTLLLNTTGLRNTANGDGALKNNTTGSLNIAVGNSAGTNLTTGSNNIDIGAPGTAGESSKIHIGKQGTQNGTFIAGIFGVTMTGSPVVVNSSGKLGVSGTSSIRFKKAVKPVDNASEAILALKPVTFRYKEEIDPEGIPQFGLVAEEVEKVNSDLITRDEAGKPATVRYEAVNAMLLNEFLKEHKKVEEQGAMIAQQQKQIEALTATVQKVGEKLELAKAAPQLVTNP
jgi:hypothetical protein